MDTPALYAFSMTMVLFIIHVTVADFVCLVKMLEGVLKNSYLHGAAYPRRAWPAEVILKGELPWRVPMIEALPIQLHNKGATKMLLRKFCGSE